MDKIIIRGARTHNLANIDLELPRDKLIVLTSPSKCFNIALHFKTINLSNKSSNKQKGQLCINSTSIQLVCTHI